MSMRRRKAVAAISPDEATDLLRRIVQDGTVAWSRHALGRAGAGGITTVECVRAMLDGVSDPPHWQHRRWRYRIHIDSICVVVVFRSPGEAVVVDAWRKRR